MRERRKKTERSPIPALIFESRRRDGGGDKGDLKHLSTVRSYIKWFILQRLSSRRPPCSRLHNRTESLNLTTAVISLPSFSIFLFLYRPRGLSNHN